MARTLNSRAALSRHEDRCWVFAFCYYVDAGYTVRQADKFAWRDLCQEFRRLGRYVGAHA
jgi:hypothetical protein